MVQKRFLGIMKRPSNARKCRYPFVNAAFFGERNIVLDLQDDQPQWCSPCQWYHHPSPLSAPVLALLAAAFDPPLASA
jgi:thiol-disulfide isomerase/thioredoxin